MNILMWPLMFFSVALFLMQLSQGEGGIAQMLFRIGSIASLGVTLLIIAGILRERKQRIAVSPQGLRYADGPLIPANDIQSIDVSADHQVVTVHTRSGTAPKVWKLPLELDAGDLAQIRSVLRLADPR